MPLEACMIVMDTSEYMRNGDYAPTRFLAQTDAVNVIFNAKTGSNPENTVGVMCSGGSPQVLATLTQDIGKILSAISKASIGGAADLLTSLNVASLALKHRENKNQRQRIVCFVGSPVSMAPGAGASKTIEDSLVKLGKKLKKNNVAVDVVIFGDEGLELEDPLRKFVEAVGSADNSHIISVPPGAHLLSDVIASSPILAAEGGAAPPVGADGFQEFPEAMAGGAAAGGGGGGGGDFGGIDPNMDPELAMAIRMSLQEAEERERRERGEAAPAAAAPAEAPTTSSAPAAPSTSESAPLLGADSDVNMDSSAAAAPPAAAQQDTEMAAADEDDEDEDAAMLRAIAMSMEGQGGGDANEEKKE